MQPASLTPEHRWECPNCDLVQVTHEARPHSRMHKCAGLFGMTVPMVAAGTRAKIELQTREDYVGSEIVTTTPEGTPIMAAVVTRDDGQDCAVYAPVATGRAAA